MDLQSNRRPDPVASLGGKYHTVPMLDGPATGVRAANIRLADHM